MIPMGDSWELVIKIKKGGLDPQLRMKILQKLEQAMTQIHELASRYVQRCDDVIAEGAIMKDGQMQ